MSKRLVFALVLMVLGAIGLSSCDACVMVAPDLVSPELWDILSGPLEWSYSDTSCIPDNFEISLSRDSLFSVVYDIEIVPGTTTTLTPSGLDPGEYYWRVRAEDEGTYGPYPSMLRSFFTGPVCDPADLVAPELVYPPYGGIYDYDYDLIDWHWPQPGCIPESYRVEVSQFLDFHDAPRNEHLGNPTTAWSFGSRPPDATQYFWRITPHVDGSLGPPSEIGMFYTGPICTAASLVEAVPLTPLDNEFVPIGNPEFTWSYPDAGCVPEGIHLRIYNTWDWDSEVLDVYNPTTATGSFQAEVPLPDCNDYLWQVTMVSEGVEGPLNIGQRFIVDSGSCDCEPGDSTIPMLLSPEPHEILPDTNAGLRWDNPGGCFSDGQSVKISPDPDFVDTSRDVIIPVPFNGGFDPPDLNPATQYWWKVAYYIEDGSGAPISGDFSDRRSFFTGPECALITEVMEPVRLEPADGSTVDTTLPRFRYQPGDPGCLPDEYIVNLHMLPDLSDPNLMGRTVLPVTSVMPASDLINCEFYYWMVTPVQDVVEGPHSTIGSFFVNEGGLCPSPGSPGTAKSNNFCRKGTFAEHFEALWTFNEGDRVNAVARNPLGTYLKFIVVDQESMQPIIPETYCWSYIGNFESDLPGAFDQLPNEEPPAPPPEKPVQLICKSTLGEDDCKQSGGTYWPINKICQCP
jgi:hypothetical protein